MTYNDKYDIDEVLCIATLGGSFREVQLKVSVWKDVKQWYTGWSDVPPVINVHVECKGVKWVVGATFVEWMVVRWGGYESYIGKVECEVFVEFVVGLFDHVAAACYFCELSR